MLQLWWFLLIYFVMFTPRTPMIQEKIFCQEQGPQTATDNKNSKGNFIKTERLDVPVGQEQK